MRWFTEYFFQAENGGHSALDEVTDQSDLRAVPENRFQATELVFALGCFGDWEVEELKEFK